MEDKGLKSFGLLSRKIAAFRACEVKKKQVVYSSVQREKERNRQKI